MIKTLISRSLDYLIVKNAFSDLKLGISWKMRLLFIVRIPYTQ